MHRFLEYKLLIPLAILLGLAPFIHEPHLIQKSRMLISGNLRRPLDIFDLVWHAWPLVLLGIRIGQDLGRYISRRGDRP